jgi:hypothetical protein
MEQDWMRELVAVARERMAHARDHGDEMLALFDAITIPLMALVETVEEHGRSIVDELAGNRFELTEKGKAMAEHLGEDS